MTVQKLTCMIQSYRATTKLAMLILMLWLYAVVPATSCPSLSRYKADNKHVIYTVRKTNTSLSKIDHDLETENVTALEEIIKEEKEMKRSNNNYSVSCNSLDKSKIKKITL